MYRDGWIVVQVSGENWSRWGVNCGAGKDLNNGACEGMNIGAGEKVNNGAVQGMNSGAGEEVTTGAD